MKSKKVFILLPDGVGLRNFAFTDFVKIGRRRGWEIVFWNQTVYDLEKLGYQQLKTSGKPRPKTDLLKRAKINAELSWFAKKFDDPVYNTYKFPPRNKGIKAKLKNQIVAFFERNAKDEKEITWLRESLKTSERKSIFYKKCQALLEEEKPDLVFCTNQRPVNAIAPLTAAEDLGIPTASFIFSWDNLPKATMVVDPDYYLVWSELMKKELQAYYPHIRKQQIFITGSPQFEPHLDKNLVQSREEFFKEHQLDPDKDYLCFSGDDTTTSPFDEFYLKDLAKAISNLNKQGHHLGIIFRRCPVDLSGRYDKVMAEFPEIIYPVAPKWKPAGENWNQIYPEKEDLALLANTIRHSEAVFNLGSSMVFDFAVFDKACFYLNYLPVKNPTCNWTPQKVYNFVHFRSMPDKKAVVWINKPEEFEEKILETLNAPGKHLESAKNWFKTINLPPADKASERIWEKIDLIKK